MTRLRSRAWNRNAIRPPGSFRTAACRATVHFPERSQWLRREPLGRGVDVGRVEGPIANRGEAGPLAVSDVGLGRLQRPPVGGHLQAPRVRRSRVPDRCHPPRRRAAAAGSPSRSSRTRPHRSGGTGCVPRRRRGRSPARSDWRRRATRRSRCRRAIGYSTRRSRACATTLSMSCSKPNSGVWTPMIVRPASAYFAAHARRYGQGPEPVDAGVGPEVDQDDASAESFRRQRRGVEPRRRPVERRQVALDRQGELLACQAMDDRPDRAGPAVRVGGYSLAGCEIRAAGLVGHGHVSVSSGRWDADADVVGLSLHERCDQTHPARKRPARPARS